MLTETLDVRDEVWCRVAREIDVGLGGVRRAPSAPALIEEHDAIRRGVEEPRMPGRAPGARTAVEHHGRFAERVAARLPIHAVAVADVEHPVPVGIDPRIQVHHVEVWGRS